jgi:sugar/nucleoside kinase (ribokinase family)
MILVFGTVCVDRVCRLALMPETGGYVEAASEVRMLGGEAANTAYGLRSWGSEVVLACNGIAEDTEGDFLRSELARRGIEPIADHVLPTARTPVCDVFVDNAGQRTMIGFGFSDMESTVDPTRLPYRGGQWFTVEPNMVQAARSSLLLAHQAGMRIYAMDMVKEGDPVPAGSYWQTSTDWAGGPGDAGSNLAWLRRFVEKHDCFAILTDGANGFVAGSRDVGIRHYAAFRVDRPAVDSTGAGDLFRAGMLFGLDRGWPIEHCLRFASAAGCLACRTLGATSQVPTVQEIETVVRDS